MGCTPSRDVSGQHWVNGSSSNDSSPAGSGAAAAEGREVGGARSERGGSSVDEESKQERGPWVRKVSKPNLAIKLDDDGPCLLSAGSNKAGGPAGSGSASSNSSCRHSFADSPHTPGDYQGSLRLRPSNYVTAVEDRLVKVGRLGKGASASVFKAVDVDTLQLVAVKVIRFDSRDTRVHRLIRHEVNALRSQRSPLLSQTFGVDATTTPCPYISRFYGCIVDKMRMQASIAMEYECCGSLEDWSKEGMPTPEPWLAHVAYSVLQALSFIHSKMHRVHRDVKPSNILLSDAKLGTMTAKLSDFGIAVDATPITAGGQPAPSGLGGGGSVGADGAVDGAGGDGLSCASSRGTGSAPSSSKARRSGRGSKRTMLKSPTGTRRYMAPERLALEGYAFNSDVWSVGLTLATVANGGECPLPLAGTEFDQLGMALAAERIICGAVEPSPAAAIASQQHRASAPAQVQACTPQDAASQQQPQAGTLRRSSLMAQDSSWDEAELAAVRSRLCARFAPSAEFRDFLRCCLAPDPCRRSDAHALLTHPFLAKRAGWERACPEVLAAAEDRRRARAGSETARGVVAAIAAARHGEVMPAQLVSCGAGLAALARELDVGEEGLLRMFSDAARAFRGRGGRPLCMLWPSASSSTAGVEGRSAATSAPPPLPTAMFAGAGAPPKPVAVAVALAKPTASGADDLTELAGRAMVAVAARAGGAAPCDSAPAVLRCASCSDEESEDGGEAASSCASSLGWADVPPQPPQPGASGFRAARALPFRAFADPLLPQPSAVAAAAAAAAAAAVMHGSIGGSSSGSNAPPPMRLGEGVFGMRHHGAPGDPPLSVLLEAPLGGHRTSGERASTSSGGASGCAIGVVVTPGTAPMSRGSSSNGSAATPAGSSRPDVALPQCMAPSDGSTPVLATRRHSFMISVDAATVRAGDRGGLPEHALLQHGVALI